MQRESRELLRMAWRKALPQEKNESAQAKVRMRKKRGNPPETAAAAETETAAEGRARARMARSMQTILQTTRGATERTAAEKTAEKTLPGIPMAIVQTARASIAAAIAGIARMETVSREAETAAEKKTAARPADRQKRKAYSRECRQESRMDLMKPGERLDDLQIKGYQILQDPSAFCFGMDAVLLSGFVRIRPACRVIDLCTGNGVIPILLAAKTKASHIEGLEIQPQMADMAERSVRLNGLEERIHITTGDVKEASTRLGASSYDAVTVNPPYMTGGKGLVNPQQTKAVARHEICCTLEDVIRESSRLLVPGGRFFMVHRPFRLTEILCLMHEYHLEPKRLRMVQSFADEEPVMILVEGLRGGHSGVRIERPLIIYESQGVYGKDVRDIYGLS